MNKIETLLNEKNLAQFFELVDHEFVLISEKREGFESIFPQYMHLFVNAKFLGISLQELILQRFPFISEPKQNIVNSILERNEKIKTIIKTAIKNRNSLELKTPELDYDDKVINSLARKAIKSLNGFIYKYKINKFWVDVLLMNDQAKNTYLTNIEFLCSNESSYFLCLFKFSKTPFTDKYLFEIELLKETLNKVLKMQIKKVILINVLDEQSVKEI